MKQFILDMRFAALLLREKEPRHSRMADYIQQQAMNIELSGKRSTFWKRAKEFINGF